MCLIVFFILESDRNYRAQKNFIPHMKINKFIPGILGPILCGLILFFFHPEGLSTQANAVLACTIWIAIWWIFEVTDISVTALLPIVLFPLTGALEISQTTAAYGHKYIFLYIGGFILAIAIEKWNLHKRIALSIINFIGASTSRIILGFMLATAFMSMWVSNTATTVMMLPIALAIVLQLKDDPTTEINETEYFGKSLMLAVAYSASIGGMATLFGTPPNLVLAGVVKETYGIEIGFMDWMKFGLPISILLLTICWVYLTKYAFSFKMKEFPGGKAKVQSLLNDLGKWSVEEKRVAMVFFSVAMMLIFRQKIQIFIPAMDDTIIALGLGILLFLIPSSDRKRALLTWEEAVKMPWGVLLLFGGGMALAAGFKDSGLALWIGTQFELLKALPILLLILILITAVNFLTEITSNMATTAMLLPILAPLAFSIDVHPYVLLVSATVAASCAFMLPVATPPNAIVFGSGYLKISDMIKTGIWMNIISIIILTILVYWFLPNIWDFDSSSFPEEFRSKLGGNG